MKKLLIFVLIAVILISLPMGCGKDGADGLAFLRITFLYQALTYWDNNDGIPYGFNWHQYYEVLAGTYNFNYTAWDASYWVGTYTITIHAGEKGGLLKSGADGADINWSLYLYSIGPSIVESEANHQSELALGKQAGMSPSDVFSCEKSKLTGYTLDPQVIVEEQQQGNVTIRLEYQRAYLKE